MTHLTTPLAVRPARALLHIVSEASAIRYWVDEQIKAGLTDGEIEAQAPVALAFLNGDITFVQMEEAVKAGRS